jgi:hypothetical protein
MIVIRYQLYCNNCGKEYKESFDDEKDLLEYSALNGWVRKKVENGSEWDFCPKCKEKRKEL